VPKDVWKQLRCSELLKKMSRKMGESYFCHIPPTALSPRRVHGHLRSRRGSAEMRQPLTAGGHLKSRWAYSCAPQTEMRRKQPFFEELLSMDFLSAFEKDAKKKNLGAPFFRGTNVFQSTNQRRSGGKRLFRTNFSLGNQVDLIYFASRACPPNLERRYVATGRAD